MEPSGPDAPRADHLAEGRVTGKIIECCYRVYDGLEFGYFESVYRNALAKRPVLNYLRASTLDVGLLLHFGPNAKIPRLVSPRLLEQERYRQ